MYGKSAIINAWYKDWDNSIEIPLAYINSEEIHPDVPMFLNYGGVGWALGHELSHGFDDTGHAFDDEGNRGNNGWSNHSIMEFENRTSCFLNQYESYSIPGMSPDEKVNGESILGENIADNAGMKSTFNAYLKYEKESGAEPSLPGLKYSSKQLFFIRAASMYCGKYRKQKMEHNLKKQTHPFGFMRVIGSVSNSDDFAKGFQVQKR